jgi:hypothetical protein
MKQIYDCRKMRDFLTKVVVIAAVTLETTDGERVIGDLVVKVHVGLDHFEVGSDSNSTTTLENI